MEDQEISIFPERTVVYAGFWQRFAAALIDGIITLIPGYMLQRATGGSNWLTDIQQTGSISSATIITNISSIIINWLYMAGMESSENRASVGKMALGIVVTDLDGNRITFGQASGRFFAKYLSSIILAIGYLMMLWDDKNQTLHDKLAHTLVVQK